jgi:hypothetical protein
MKTQFLSVRTSLALSILSLAGGAFAQSTPIAYYPLDGDGQDASGNNFHGVVSGTTPTTDRFGNPVGALLFGNEIDRVNCGNPAAFNFAGPFTLSAWVKPNGDTVDTYIVAKYDFDPSTGGSSPHSYGMGVAGTLYPYGFVGLDSGYYDVIGWSGPMTAGQWQAIAFVYDGAAMNLYLNGSLIASQSVSGVPPFVNSVPLMIGGTTVSQVFSGAIDDVRIYNTGLTPAEVAAQYTADVPPPPPVADALVAYYPLNHNAHDKSGNGHHGTITGTTSIPDRFGKRKRALMFNGDTDRINCGNPAEFNFAGPFTLSAWVKPNGDKVDTYIVAKYDFDFNTFIGTPHSYGMGNADFLFPYGFVGGDFGYSDIRGFGGPMTPGQWQALAFVYDGQYIGLYLNGGLIGSQLVGQFPPFVNSIPLTIGGTISGQGFSGGIDDVRIYNRALSSSEVNQVYQDDLVSGD